MNIKNNEFWNNLYEQDKLRDNFFICNSWHFVIGEKPDPKTPKHCLGCGGDDYYIKFNDGRLVHTNNLWCQGEIPKKLLHYFPDTAKFINREEFNKNKNI